MARKMLAELVPGDVVTDSGTERTVEFTEPTKDTNGYPLVIVHWEDGSLPLKHHRTHEVETR